MKNSLNNKKGIITNLRRAMGEKLFGNSTARYINQIIPFLKPKDKIIDLGAGTSVYTKLLKNKGYNVQPVDIKNYSYYSDIGMCVYDGKHLPFKNNDFDVCLLRSVLHHSSDPEVVLKEAVRVSKKLIIHENVITNIFQRYYTFLIDCIMNKELIEPHTNKTDEEWRALFKRLNLDLVDTIDEKAFLFLQNKTYVLKKL